LELESCGANLGSAIRFAPPNDGCSAQYLRRPGYEIGAAWSCAHKQPETPMPNLGLTISNLSVVATD